MDLTQKVGMLVEKIRESYNAAFISYEVIIESDDQDKYILAMEFINNVTLHFISAKDYYESDSDLERHDFETYFEAFSNYKFELFQVIKEKDKNTSWLGSRRDSLVTAKKDVEDIFDILKGTSTI